ncbi:MAG: NAD-dependent epimerase/dehydratase family protein [Candidatus Aenigmarchaeota archaeon]|nr:NAD-dependent epimerase/dehydratase family protein [Candidatus Aenigmarchaeota archaeon]
MKVLVTGGAGFIGSHLSRRLVALGNDVVVMDNLSTGKKEHVPPGAHFIKGDICEPLTVSRAMKDCSAVFHLAASADARGDADTDYKVNFLGAQTVFERAAKHNVKVVFTSSAAVYGDAKVPHREDIQCKPVSPYGKSKLKAERAAPKNSFIIRVFNCYGPRGKGVVNTFCRKIPEYEDITVYGNGLQTRDYVYVSDVVDALLLGFDNAGVYNVGTGSETSLLNLIDVIHKVANAKPHVTFALARQEVARSRADIGKIRRELGWEPKIQLEEGIGLVLQGTSPVPEKPAA